MVATHWRFAVASLALCGLVGCRSGGSWSMPTFSSKSRKTNQEIASAPPAPRQATEDPQLPSAVAGQAAAASPYAPSSYPSTYPETPVAYDTTLPATAPAAPAGGGYPSGDPAAAPASHLGERYAAGPAYGAPQQGGVAPQRGPYDTTYPGAASEPPVVDRYGQPSAYGAAPPPADDVFATGDAGGAPGQPYDAAAYAADSQPAGPPAAYPATYPSTDAAVPAQADRYSTAGGASLPAAPAAEEFGSPDPQYRPGGTSDFPGASQPVVSDVQPAGYDEPAVPQRASAPSPRYGGQFEAPPGSNGGRLY